MKNLKIKWFVIKQTWKRFIIVFKKNYNTYMSLSPVDKNFDIERYLSQFRNDVNNTFKFRKNNNILKDEDENDEDENDDLLFKIYNEKIINYVETTNKYEYHLKYDNPYVKQKSQFFKRIKKNIKAFIYIFNMTSKFVIVNPYKAYLKDKKLKKIILKNFRYVETRGRKDSYLSPKKVENTQVMNIIYNAVNLNEKIKNIRR